MSDILNGLQSASGDAKLGAVAGIVGAVIGAMLGALLGALTTYILSERARKKQKEQDEINVQRLKVRAHQRAIQMANSEIEGLLVLALKNLVHYADLQKGIVDTNNNFRSTISMPQPYQHQRELLPDMLNSHFAAKWLSYETEIVLQNANLRELNTYYVGLQNSMHELLLTGGTASGNVIQVDNTVIIKGATDQIEATESLKQRGFDLLAEMELGAKQWKKLDFTKPDLTLNNVEKLVDKLHTYAPTDKQLNKLVEEYKKTYVPEKAFRVAAQSANLQ